MCLHLLNGGRERWGSSDERGPWLSNFIILCPPLLWLY
jgi:hypothetical protein